MSQLPDINGEALEFTFHTEGGADWMNPEWLVVTCGSEEIHREPSGFENWEPLIEISEAVLARYSGRVAWIDAGEASCALAGDSLSAADKVEKILEEQGVGTTPILCTPGQEFSGHPKRNLLPRLRLDPELGTVDLWETPVMIYLDDEPILDMDVTPLLGTGPNDGELCTWGNGAEIGGRFDIQGGWLEVFTPGIKHELRWIGLEVDLTALARQCLNEALAEWDPDEDGVVELTSPHLAPGKLQ